MPQQNTAFYVSSWVGLQIRAIAYSSAKLLFRLSDKLYDNYIRNIDCSYGMINDRIIYNVIAKKYTYSRPVSMKLYISVKKGKYICLVEWNIRLTVCVQAGRRNRSWNLRSRRKREEWSLVQIFPFFGFFKEISFAQLSNFWKTFLFFTFV